MFLRSDRAAVASCRTATTRCVHHPCQARPRPLGQRHVTRASGNHYDILGVPESASNEEIKTAFRRKAKELHPDVSTEADAELRFKECSRAYEVLVDSEARQAYDSELMQSRKSSMGNFFRDVDFEDDEYIDLDEWRRERRESYTQADTSDGGLQDETAYADVFRDPAQFLDRLNSEQPSTCKDTPNKLIDQLEQVLAVYGEDVNFRDFVAAYREDPRDLQYLRDFHDGSESSSSQDDDDADVPDEELGAWLSSYGVQQDAASFVQEMGVMCGAMQIASCALCFYCMETFAGCDAGEAFRMTAGLGLGYITRMSVKVENLLYPLYNDIVGLLAPASRTFIAGVNKQNVQETLEATGNLLFLLLFIPQALFHLDAEGAGQLVGCWVLGWVLADLFNIIALFIKVSRCD